MGASRRILIVEDHEDTRVSTALLLGRRGHAVSAARDATEALELLVTTRFDVVILDLGLPGVDGFVLATRIRELSGARSTTPIVAFTGYVGSATRAHCQRAGFAGYLRKPCTANQIESEMAVAVGE